MPNATIIQESSGNPQDPASSTTYTVQAFGSNCTVGSYVEVVAIWAGSPTNIPTVNDGVNSGNYTQHGAVFQDSNDGTNLCAFVFHGNTSTAKLAPVLTWATAVTYRGAHSKEVGNVTAVQQVVGQDQASPGTTAGAISTSATGTLATSPALFSVSSSDDGGGASSVIVSPLTGGTTDWILTGGGGIPGLTTGSMRVTSTTSIAGTLTNTTDGGSRRFLTLGIVYTENASAGAALAGDATDTTSATASLTTVPASPHAVVVQETTGNAVTSAALTSVQAVAFTANCTVGTAIEAVVIWAGSPTNIPTVNDGVNGSNYTQYGAVFQDSNDGTNFTVFVLFNNTSTAKLAPTATWGTAVNYAGVHTKEIANVSLVQQVVGQDQVTPGNGVGAIQTGSTGTLAAAPAFFSCSSDNDGNVQSSAVAGSLVAGITGDWILTGAGGVGSLTTGSQRVTTTAAINGTFTNTSTDGTTRRFLTLGVVYTEVASAAFAAGATTTTAAAAALSTAIKAAADATDTTTASGALTTAVRMAAAALSTTVGSATFGALFNAVATDTTTATAALITGKPLAGAAADTTNASAQLVNWTTVTLTAPVNTGAGSICDPNGWLDNPPVAGDTLYYDGTNLLILPNGDLYSVAQSFQALVQFNDGTGWNNTTVVFQPGLASYANDVTTAIAAMSTGIQLAAAAISLTQATAAMTTAAHFQAAAQTVTSATAAMITAIFMNATAVDTTLATAVLNTQPWAAAATDTTTGSAILNTSVQMIAAATDLTLAAAALATQILAVANANDTTSASASLNAGVLFQAQAQDTTAASAGMVTQVILASAANSITVASASLLSQIQLGANATDTTVAAAALTAQNSLFGAATDSTSATASLTALIELVGGALTQTLATAGMTSQTLLNAAAIDSSYATAALDAPGSAVGILQPDPWFVVLHRRRSQTTIFPQFAPGDERVLTFNFSDDLPPGVYLNGRITISCVCTAGVDPNIVNELVVAPSYDSKQTDVLQLFQGGLDGCDYYFTAQAPTSAGTVLSRFGLLQVRA